MGKVNTLPPDEVVIDATLRPGTWDEYIGQNVIKKNIRVMVEAAKKRNEPLDHILLHGAAGLGKTTLVHLVSKEMGANIKVTSGPALEKTGDIAAILSALEPHDVLFIDEAHRVNTAIEEMLYPAMEAGKIHVMLGKGLGSQMMSLDLPPFTLIAATTRVNLLSSPLRSRFGGMFKLEYYDLKDIEQIIARSAQLLKIGIEKEAIALLAKASRFTPRIANRLLKRARDFADVHNEKKITEDCAVRALALFEIDELGLEATDRKLLEIIIKKFSNRPVGLTTLAAALGEDKGTIEEVYEPYLLRVGLIQRTPSGRICTHAAYEHLGLL